MKRNHKKIFSLFSILVIIFFISIRPVSAQMEITGTVNAEFDGAQKAIDGMGGIFGELGVNEAALKNAVKSLNVMQQKKYPPQVSLTFTPTDPANGGKVTATATPSYFMNSTKDLYFTWFLKQDGCDATDHPSSEEADKCDLDGNGRVNVEDWKIKAMRILASSDFDWQNADYSSQSGGGDGYEAINGGNDQGGKPHSCWVHDPSSGYEVNIPCNDEHLFPDAPHETTGNGRFGLGEEEFWHTDPNNKDTAGTGNTDEANVAGLGENNFAWNYTSGDQLGVVVEGISIEATQDADASYKTMWAFPVKMCDLNVTVTQNDDNTTTVTQDTIGSPKDLNDCLYDNLIDPVEGGGAAERLKINLSYSPENPINDTGGKSGDQVTVKSSMANADKADYINYTWEVFESDDPNPDDWGEALTKDQIPDASQTTGLGLDTFSFKMNFPELKNYLRIKVTAQKSASAGVMQTGNADIVIPVSAASENMQVFKTSIDDNLQISMPDSDSEAICKDGPDSVICPIVKGSIIGVKTKVGDMTNPDSPDYYKKYNYSWTVNGQPVTYKECFYDGCDPNDPNNQNHNNFAYFPVMEDVGANYTVSVSAMNPDTGGKVSLSKTFVVAEPSVKIVSSDANAKPLLLGYYKKADPSGTLLYPDTSANDFEAIFGYPIQFQANFLGFSPDANSYLWAVNEQPVSASIDPTQPSVDNGTLTVPTGQVGDSYTVSVGAIYAPDSKTELALSKIWGVTPGDLYAKPVGASANVRVVNVFSNQSDSGQTTAQAKAPKKILATIYSSLPSYLAFLFRITLTAFILLFFSGLVLSFFPEMREE